ncbi:hypothetical protein RQP46_010830 [Phenoliferia psychrophenolica]
MSIALDYLIKPGGGGGANGGGGHNRTGSIKDEGPSPTGASGGGLSASVTGMNPDGTPRTGRACLACRKLKTRCDGADDPPCKRCRAGPHECIFVESKRGKRPAKKAPDPSLADKLRTVERTLSRVLDSMNSGSTPDQTTLEQLKAELAEGLKADAAAGEREKDRLDAIASKSRKGKRRGGPGEDGGASASGSEDGGNGRKKGRLGGDDLDDGEDDYSPRSSYPPIPSIHRSHGSPLQYAGPGPGRSPSHQIVHGHGHSSAHSGSAPALEILANASLAAEIEGRTQVTGLDPTFTLSSITQAISVNKQSSTGAIGENGQRTAPALLTKGIIDADTAVELFRIFFDYAYIHLPLLDPEYSTATSVLARSPFLFTVICAVASRFHSDASLHVACYEAAHVCFVDCVAGGERSLESVQACMILTVWTSAPREGSGEDRPKRAWLYFGMAVRMGLELGLFRPPAFVDQHLVANGHLPNPWINLKGVPDDEQRDALSRERTWLLIFVIDRNMSAVMGRPYQIQDAKPLLLPLHPMSLPFDLGVIAHQELQSIIGQVMDTFRERIYGLSSASDEMPSPVVMKLFNSRMDDWQQRWCPVAGEPIANNLLFYFHSNKLFLNTFPLHTMLRTNSQVSDPSSVSSTISSAMSIIDLGHNYAELGVLRHCPDVNFLLLLYAAVFLIKVKASNTRFSSLVDDGELQHRITQCIVDCRNAGAGDRHASATCSLMLRALLASWKAMGAVSHQPQVGQGQQQQQQAHDEIVYGGTSGAGQHGGLVAHHGGLAAGDAITHQRHSHQNGGVVGGHDTPTGPPSSAPYAFLNSPFANGGTPGTRTPNGGNSSNASGQGNGNNYGYGLSDPLDHFLADTNFFNSVLVSQGADGFFSWADSMGSAGAAGMVDGDEWMKGFGEENGQGGQRTHLVGARNTYDATKLESARYRYASPFSALVNLDDEAATREVKVALVDVREEGGFGRMMTMRTRTSGC